MGAAIAAVCQGEAHFEHIAAGRSDKEIAQQLYITRATVKTHINNLFAKTGARDRTQAVTYAYRHGLVSVEPDAGSAPPAGLVARCLPPRSSPGRDRRFRGQ